MKRLLLSLVTASFATSALAAFPIGTNPAGSFVIGATGAYLQAIPSNGDFDFSQDASALPGKISGFVNNLESDYHWAWGAYLSYFAPNGVNDMTLRYFHARNGNNDSMVSGAQSVSLIPPTSAAAIGHSVFGSQVTELDQVDLVGGQYMPVGSCLNLHPFFGLRWAELKRDLDATVHNVITNVFSVMHQDSKFTGIGPSIGMNGNYFLTPHFSLIGHVATSLLVGEIKPHAAVLVGLGAHDFEPLNKIHRVVPSIDVKLGADYTYVFDSATLSHLSVELGWRFSEYFNVLDTINFNTINTADGIVTPSRTTSADLSLQGPYLELSVAF